MALAKNTLQTFFFIIDQVEGEPGIEKLDIFLDDNTRVCFTTLFLNYHLSARNAVFSNMHGYIVSHFKRTF